MGADLIGWIGCRLQQDVGPEGFLGKLKLRAYRRAIEAQVPEGQRARVKLRVHVTGRPDRELDYPAIVAESEAFLAGIPECLTCPIARGETLGCYRYVTYPVDAAFETLVFQFLLDELKRPGSIGDQFYENLVSSAPTDSAWHTRRGAEAGALAALPAPIAAEHDGKPVDSAQLMQALFLTTDDPELVCAYGVFWAEFLQFARGRTEGSRTCEEIARLAPLLVAMGVRAAEAPIALLVDA